MRLGEKELPIPSLKRRTVAGIILFNPNILDLQKSINILRQQVDKILLIDNGSENTDEIRSLVNTDYSGMEILWNKTNKGIAQALNQLLGYAARKGYDWYLSMDQDSLCDEKLIENYEKYVDDTSIGILCPYILNNHKIEYEEWQSMDLPLMQRIDDPLECITSGSLTRTQFAVEAGGYDDFLFIDGVDADFNAKMNLLNNKIIRVNSTYLIQQMGKGYEVKWIRKLAERTGSSTLKHLSVTPVYSNFRLFYISRNAELLHDKYGKLAGKRLSRSWVYMQFVYYCLTYPRSVNRYEMLKAIHKGRKEASRIIYNRKSR